MYSYFDEDHGDRNVHRADDVIMSAVQDVIQSINTPVLFIPCTTLLTLSTVTMSYAEAASKGPKQTAEDVSPITTRPATC